MDLLPVKGQLQLLLLEQRAIRLGETLGESTHVDTLVDPIDSDTHVPDLDRRPLRAFKKFIGLQARSISIVLVGKPPRDRIAWTAGLNGESPSEMPDGRLAALTVLTQQLPATFGRTAPAQIIAFNFTGAHPLAPNCGYDERLGMDGDLYGQLGLWNA